MWQNELENIICTIYWKKYGFLFLLNFAGNIIEWVWKFGWLDLLKNFKKTDTSCMGIKKAFYGVV